MYDRGFCFKRPFEKIPGRKPALALAQRGDFHSPIGHVVVKPFIQMPQCNLSVSCDQMPLTDKRQTA